MVIIPETSTVPADFCPATLAEAWAGLVPLQTVTIPDDLGYNYGYYSGGVPDAADQDKPWIRLNADGSLDRVYTFFTGVWASPHPVPPDGATNLIQLYDGDATSLDTFDGGSAGAVTATTGPFWEIIADFGNRIPIGAGTTTALNANEAELTATAPTQDCRGVNFVKRSDRIYFTYPV